MVQKHVKRSPAAIKEALCGYISISPWLVGFIILTFIPILSTIYYSFTRWTIMDAPVWIGLENYIRMFSKEPLFYQAVRATSLYVAMSLPVIIVFGVLLSLLLNMKIKGMNFYRTLFYIPAVISGVSIAMLWTWLLQPDVGIVNTLLSYLGVQGPKRFGDQKWVLPSVDSMSQ